MATQLVQPWKKWYQPNEHYEKPTHFVVPIMAAGNAMPEPDNRSEGRSNLGEPKPKLEESRDEKGGVNVPGDGNLQDGVGEESRLTTTD